MVDRELVGKKDCTDKKTVESYSALSREVEEEFRPLRNAASHPSADASQSAAQSDAIQSKLDAIVVAKKCEASNLGLGYAPSNLVFPELHSNGTRLGHVAPDHVFSYEPESQVDFEDNDIWHKKTIDKKIINNKLHKLEFDYAPVPTLYPMTSQLIARVDQNQDGTMSNREITRALNGEELNEKEKHMLEVLKKNKDLIDNDRNGISVRDIKEFDAKVVQYNKELAMSRKFAPELADFARTLNQRGKLVDENHDGKFSREELQNFYLECKKELLEKPTAEGKRELQTIGWGLANYNKYALLTGRSGEGQITIQSLRSQALRELDRGAPREFRENFLSPSDRYRVERYLQSR